MPVLGDEVTVDNPASGRVYYECVSRDGFEYKIGDCCYIMPEAYGFNVKPATSKRIKNDRKDVSNTATSFTLIITACLMIYSMRSRNFLQILLLACQ